MSPGRKGRSLSPGRPGRSPGRNCSPPPPWPGRVLSPGRNGRSLSPGLPGRLPLSPPGRPGRSPGRNVATATFTWSRRPNEITGPELFAAAARAGSVHAIAGQVASAGATAWELSRMIVQELGCGTAGQCTAGDRTRVIAAGSRVRDASRRPCSGICRADRGTDCHRQDD